MPWKIRVKAFCANAELRVGVRRLLYFIIAAITNDDCSPFPVTAAQVQTYILVNHVLLVLLSVISREEK